MKCIEDEIPFDVPEGWEWCRLNSIVDVRDGTHDTPTYVDKGIPLITSKNLVKGGIDYSNVKYISEKDAISINERSGVNIGDILFAMIGTIGNPSMVTEDILISIKNVALFKFTFSKNLSNHFVMYFLDYAQEDMKNKPSGGLQPFVSLNFLRTYLVPVPPVEEQQRIVSILADSINKIRNIDVLKNELTASVKKAKSKILDLAIRGKLIPQDPNDEPASVLLERIRAEKEELINQGKIKRNKKESVIFKGDDNSYYEKVGNNVHCIDEKIPFELPEGWAFIRLNTAWELISGRDLSPSEYNDKNDGIPYITGASNFKNGHISLVRWTPVPQVITRRGDLLLTCKGTIGEIAHNNFGEAHIARQIMAIRNIYSLNVDFLALCIEYSMTKIKQAAKGLIPGISREDILNLVIPIPPTKEQENICNKLKVTFSAIEHIEKSLN